MKENNMQNIRICGNNLKLVFDTPDNWAPAGMGRYFVDRIVINKNLPKDIQANTLMHELVHCIADQNDLQINDNETEISVIANNLHAILKDNKKLVKQMWEL